MTKCPKCGGNKIIGPKFYPATRMWEQERLGYTCFQCGYQTSTPTKDAVIAPSGGQ
jgi:hypothetical protein